MVQLHCSSDGRNLIDLVARGVGEAHDHVKHFTLICKHRRIAVAGTTLNDLAVKQPGIGNSTEIGSAEAYRHYLASNGVAAGVQTCKRDRCRTPHYFCAAV